MIAPRQSPSTDASEGRNPSTDDNKKLNQRWIQAFNDRDWQTETACRSAEFRAHMPGAKDALNNDDWAAFMDIITTAFPDARISIEDCIAEGDRVVSRWTLTGTQRGPFQGVLPAGDAITVPGIEFNHVVEGKIAEHWAQFDFLSLMRQIGAFRT